MSAPTIEAEEINPELDEVSNKYLSAAINLKDIWNSKLVEILYLKRTNK